MPMMLMRVLMLYIRFFEFNHILNDNFSFLYICWDLIKIILLLVLFYNKFSSFLFVSFYDLYKNVGLKMVRANRLKKIVYKDKSFFESLSSN